MSEWEEITLGEIATITMGQSPKGEDCNTGGNGLPLLNGPTEFGYRHPYPVQFTTDPKKKAVSGDLLFCVRGSTTGRMNWADQEYAIGRGIASIRSKHGAHLQPYIKVIIDQHLKELLAVATGSTFPNVSRDDLSKLRVLSPPPDIRDFISQIADTFDRKIENLRRQNETLERIAQTLFKHWFVDFEFPNADGKPYKSSGGEMVRSELGEIPVGWNFLELGDVATNHSETHNFSNKTTVIFINTGDVLEGFFLHHDYVPVKTLPGQAKKKIQRDDILYSEIRPINKRFAYVNSFNNLDDYVVSTKFMVVRSNGKILPRLLYLILTRDSTIQEFHHIAESRSGTFPQITFESVSRFPIVIPEIALQEKLMGAITPLIEKKEFNIQKIKTLTKTRDVLLPQLMSGRLRITES